MTEQTQDNKIQIKPVITPEALKGFYSTNMELTMQGEELIMDFFNVNVRTRTAILGSRIFINPNHAKRIYEALGRLIKKQSQVGDQINATSEQTGEIGFQTK